MIIIYTGNGKGKTSACVGQLIRAQGQGLRVAFAQFMKRSIDSGEQVFLAQLLGDNFIAGGEGFFYKGNAGSDNNDNANNSENSNTAQLAKQKANQLAKLLKHSDAAKKVLNWAKERITKLDMLVLDEALYALSAGLISQEELEELIKQCAEHKIHLVLSGRGAPEWLISQAELVSSIEEIKHPYSLGIKAQKGIEF